MTSFCALDVGSIDRIFGINFDQLRNAYYLVIAALLLCIMVIYLIGNSSYGRTLRRDPPLSGALPG
jgi:ABC-type branched-subunit amino acid transport system permease subunit